MTKERRLSIHTMRLLSNERDLESAGVQHLGIVSDNTTTALKQRIASGRPLAGKPATHHSCPVLLEENWAKAEAKQKAEEEKQQARELW